MAAASDKARFYLEQYVPELQEYQQKGIFTREEITAITSKRSGFEHTLNARGSTPADYARYATYEMNLDGLRKKRRKRLGIKGAKTFNGQRTVFFVLDRATKKFPGDMGLWMQYIDFCSKEKASKKLAKVFTSVLRLHPRDSSLWVLAAKHYAETQGDMGTARSYFQRGLRFCKDDAKLYLEYARLEMVYLAKLKARKRLLGLDEERKVQKEEEDDNMITLPSITAEDIDPDAGKGVEEVNEDALKRLESAPAFTGAIPVAIFDAAMKQFTTSRNAASVAESFYDLIATFENVQATPTALQHILSYLREHESTSVERSICDAKHELFAVDAQSAEFPPALTKALATIKKGLGEVPSKSQPLLAEKAALLLLTYSAAANSSEEQLDHDILQVLDVTIKRYLRILAKATGPARKGRLDGLLETLEKNGDQRRVQLQRLALGLA
ncbi:U3 small nucleolar RNA-associated protein 6 [Fulvia fulva]|nr:U3 small nucleolar RNA-associated protein 6 [Fulvia fulva]